MSGEIILNLDSPEYQDEFHSSEENHEQNGLWQQDANETLVHLLNKMGEEAKRYKNAHIGNEISPERFSSYHHAIFISGARGTGKTVFLHNAKAVWNRHVNKSKGLPNLHFIDVIDPTLLNINDRFSEVIIATVYASVDKALKRPDIKQDRKDEFYHSLKNLSGALGKSSEFDEFRGIDRIQKYRSGIHIEHYFHQFLIASVELLNCDALVLPIDDVDMKIDHAFGVLDDIRCLLSCPLILPLVSGDDDLYRHITTMRFEESLAKNQNASNFSEGKLVAERLSGAYLTKVFPNHDRLPLVPISQLLSKLKIKYKKNENDQSNEIKYSEYEDSIKAVFYPLCNGQERSTDWPQPESAREITQFTRLLTPAMLETYDENRDRLWRNYAVWAEEKQDGVALTNAESFLMINAMQRSDELDLKKVIAFNPLIQKNNYLWAKKNYYAQQVQCIADLKAYKTNVEILDTVFDNKINDVALKSNNILRSLPPLELIMHPMYVSKNVVEGSHSDHHILIAMYTYNNYYSRQRNRRHHIFFSRAFEILFWSCLAITENIPDDFMDEKLFHEKFKGVFYRVPFYSSFSFNSTKIIDESSDGDSDDLERSIEYANSIDSFISTLYKWCKENKFSELKGKNLVPLLSLVFNKVFTQLKVLRSNIISDRKAFSDEHLSDLANRFEYIFINALVSFIRDGVIIHANVATGAKSSSVRSYEEFSKYDRTLYRNLSDIPMDTNDYDSMQISHRLINTICDHPIFHLADTVYYPIGEIRSTVEQNSDDVNFNEMNFYGIRRFYYSVSGRKTVRTNEVKQWATENPDVARKIHSRMKNDSEMSLEIYGGGQIAWMFAGLSYGLGIEY
ncbi:antiviral RADAR system adenosine triphosphatase RdrA [Pectobacterium aroidearum]|uniref:antiviral RADAR system adenosine triphosphatase RdrA n=1 Tax=Pectobacterium aroidearum TaxID=1201031 RepID=UPI0026103D51|nr:antiviral RADAR system adenosine triphosphatase RdrA [Pectobacterium aroidearum]WKA60716.1 antiviral RADAR system adenosine triphosphatase RdrA [Pectobacterium aroidearum]